MPAAERMEAEMASIERHLLGQDTRLAGRVVLTCSDDWACRQAMEGLAPLLELHPEVELCMSADSRLYDLTKREADLAIRALGKRDQPPEHLIGAKLAPIVMQAYRSPAPGVPRRWLAFDDGAVSEQLVQTTPWPEAPRWGEFGTLGTMVQGGLAGLGWVLLPTYVGDNVLGLERIASMEGQELADLWLLCHPDLRRNARIRAVCEQLHAHFEAERHRFTGDPPP